MITVRSRYCPTEKSTAAARDNTYTRSGEEAYSWLCGLLAYDHHVHEVTSDGTTATIIAREYGRNTGSLFETSYTGPLPEMMSCLAAAYYWYDGWCVEPPADYPFQEAHTRQDVLDDIAKRIPLREAVGDLLRPLGYEPLKLEGMYDIRGCARMRVGVMAFAGISDPAVLTAGAGMDFRHLFDTCEFVRVLGLSFDQARVEAAPKKAA